MIAFWHCQTLNYTVIYFPFLVRDNFSASSMQQLPVWELIEEFVQVLTVYVHWSLSRRVHVRHWTSVVRISLKTSFVLFSSIQFHSKRLQCPIPVLKPVKSVLSTMKYKKFTIEWSQNASSTSQEIQQRTIILDCTKRIYKLGCCWKWSCFICRKILF